MADKKISQLTGATTPLAGTEVLPIVQGGSTVKVAVSNLTAGRAVSASSLTTTGAVSAGTSLGVGKAPATKVDIYGTGAHESFIVKLADGASANYSEFQIKFSTVDLLTWGGGASPYADKLTLGSAGTLALKTGASDRVSVDGSGNTTINTGNLVVGTAAKGIDFSANTHAAGMTSELLNWYEEGTWTPVIRGSGTAGTYELNAGASYGNYTRIGRLVSVNAQIVLAGSVTGGGTGDAQITGLPFAKSALQQSTGAVYLDTIDLDANTKYVTANFPTGNSSSTLVFNQILDNASPITLPVSAIVANAVILVQITYFV